MEEERFVKVKIYPITRFVPPDPNTKRDNKLEPMQFVYPTKSGKRVVSVDRVENKMRAPALKAGGHGYRYTCYLSWGAGNRSAKISHLWFDPRRLEWFVEVPESQAPMDWDAECQEPCPFDE